MNMPEIPSINSIQLELEEFANSIKENLIPKVTIEEAYRSLEVAFSILEKIEG